MDFKREFDLIYTWSACEHISQDVFEYAMRQFHRLLRHGGCLFTQGAPLYYSPFGSHLSSYLPQPWAHLTMQQNLFFHKLRLACDGDDEYTEMCSLYNTLNKMTHVQLSRAIENTGMREIRSLLSKNPGYEDIQDSMLLSIYHKDILLTEQAVYLHTKP